ncbi:MAG: HD domain-containing protein [Clostridia bacterium]|nr:HD domain-containing protein [Clostridia bacterium]
MAIYESLSADVAEQMKQSNSKNLSPFACKNEDAKRRIDNPHDNGNVWRTPFIRDVDKILHCPFYNRYADKTQVFSLRKNDDITRRALHVQIVSRIARTLGDALGLNTDLIEAISLGHDLGHTPFGHTGERFLDELYREKTGRRFFHNIHSVRVIDEIFPLNLTLQTQNGIAAHNGELELSKYAPAPMEGFDELDKKIEACYLNEREMRGFTPSTLEGCVMRISDIIAYLGKDRQDAEKGKLLQSEAFENYGIGTINAEIVNNLMVNLLEHSFGKGYIAMDEKHFSALAKAKKENYQLIYDNKQVKNADETLQYMMAKLYQKLLFDLQNGNENNPIFTHHLRYLDKPYYKRRKPYPETEKNQIVVDYIASMTDDYFIDLYNHLFPDDTRPLQYVGYFD